MKDISTYRQGIFVSRNNQITFRASLHSSGEAFVIGHLSTLTTYTYDALGQLIRVDDPHENATWATAAKNGAFLPLLGTCLRRILDIELSAQTSAFPVQP